VKNCGGSRGLSFQVYQLECRIPLQVHQGATVALAANNGALLAVNRNHERGGHEDGRRNMEGENMLFTLAVILFVAWLLGLVGVYTIGSIVHVLLVIALVLFLVGIISGRRTVV
jgi:hypothetical protein